MSWQRSLLIAAILLFAAVYYGLAFVALRDLRRRPPALGENKMAWALAILCLPILGATLYGYFGPGRTASRSAHAPEPEFTPFDHLFEDDDFWSNSTR
jgi:hypothetical protein